MFWKVFGAVMLPFLGTTLGSACVFFLKGKMNRNLQRSLTGFAAGVMVAASVWSLIIPAMDQSAHMGKLAFIPAFVGVWAGFLFLLLLDHFIPHLHLNSDCPEGKQCGLGKSTMMVLAVALHNLPEGMAVGVVVAGWLSGSETVSAAGALATGSTAPGGGEKSCGGGISPAYGTTDDGFTAGRGDAAGRGRSSTDRDAERH